MVTIKASNSRQSSLLEFGLERLAGSINQKFRVLNEASTQADYYLNLALDDQTERETAASRFSPDRRTITFYGGEVGILYLIIELGHRLAAGEPFSKIDLEPVAPRVSFRAVKLNLPWDPYRPGEAMALQSQEMLKHRFWTRLLDMMVENRFNALTLWSLHPFPFMIRPRNFPEAVHLGDAEFEEFRELWRFIFTEARLRGIETYLLFWNVCIPESFAQAHNIAIAGDVRGWGNGEKSELVKRYTREVIRETIDAYPDLTGIGFSLGERMVNFTPEERQAWAEETILRAIKEAARPIKLIHRAPFTADPQLMRDALDRAELDLETWVEYKFNYSHGHSSPELFMTHNDDFHKHGRRVVDDGYWNPTPENYRILWTIRNEDFFILPWGEPDYIRAHIRTNARDYCGGYIVGAEGLIPALDLSVRPSREVTWDYVFEKQALFWKMWGRLLYDPDTDDSIFRDFLESTYGPATGEPLLEAFRRASRMPLRLATFYAGTWDYSLYSEGFLAPFPSRYTRDGILPEDAFLDIEKLIRQPTLDPSWMTIPQYVAVVKNIGNPPEEGYTPEVLAEDLYEDGVRVCELCTEIANTGLISPRGLDHLLEDLRIWGHLSLYFAAKLRGAVSLELFRETGVAEYKSQAVELLTDALHEWKLLSEIGDRLYRETPYISYDKGNYRLRFSWIKFLPAVEGDIEIARRAKPRKS